MQEAVTMVIALLRQERDHALGKSEYRYPLSEPWELPGPNGTGVPAGYTGLVWGAFRPSDDPQHYPYNIPNNLFIASVLEPLGKLVEEHWHHSGGAALAAAMRDLRQTIVEGVQNYGTTTSTGEQVYCYEVDGLGNCLLMDDANVPSLLSLPYLDPSHTIYDDQIYKSTRRFILSEANPWYFKGEEAAGIGSPHTGRNKIWPLSLVMQAMTSESEDERAAVVAMLYAAEQKSSAHNGLPESFEAGNMSIITREWFAWPNALFAEHLMEQKPTQCPVSLRDLKAHLPKSTTPIPKEASPLENATTEFYTTDVKLLRRAGVVLPAAEYMPGAHSS